MKGPSGRPAFTRIYDKHSGNLFTTIESKNKLNGVSLYGNSGLLLVPQESKRIGTYFIPSLGPAPKWCSFIENLTEELVEKTTDTVYNEYKFLSKEELEKLNAGDLIGTKFVKSYMQGFILKAKLYNKLKDKAQPFDYNQYKEEKVQEKIAKELAKDKIYMKTQKTRVNQKLVESIKNLNKETVLNKARKNLLVDTRFKKLLEDKDFEKEEDHEAYKGKRLPTK